MNVKFIVNIKGTESLKMVKSVLTNLQLNYNHAKCLIRPVN